jgi:hypothetical protein
VVVREWVMLVWRGVWVLWGLIRRWLIGCVVLFNVNNTRFSCVVGFRKCESGLGG